MNEIFRRSLAGFAFAAWFLTAASFGGPSRVLAAEAKPQAGALAVVNINTADAAQLMTLHGIGPALAKRIVDYRTAFGKFTSAADLTAVPGIGSAKLESMKDHITI